MSLGAGDTRPNLLVTGPGGGQFDLRNDAGRTDVLVDIQGWFG